jgi:hypothetical protein
MRKLKALKVAGVQRKEKNEKKMFCELESFFLFLLLHFKKMISKT